MSKKLFIALILCIFFVPAFNSNSLAWDNEVTHKDLSKYAAENSVLSKNKGDYLLNIGFSYGLDEYFQWSNDEKKIREWIREGAKREDGSIREFNHFHNPLQPWSSAGLHLLGVIPVGESAVLWSQDSSAQANWSNGTSMELPYPGITSVPDNTTPTDWSWQTTRTNFYTALTAQAGADRDSNFAKTFFGLGHQMHLLQDMSVPMHVRNNQHLINRMIEGWVVNNESKALNSITTIPMPTVSLDNIINGLVPVVRLYDTDTYIGTTPIAMSDTSVGLAEWTNANFFSDDTINLPGYALNNAFPFPNQDQTNLQDVLTHNVIPETVSAEDGVPDLSVWIKRSDASSNIEHFAKVGYTTNEIAKISGNNILSKTFILDDEVYKDYASLLLPRAVGYSAALLNYFFRGRIGIVPSRRGVFGMVDAIARETAFKEIRLQAVNLTPNGEGMTSGSIKLVVRYKIAESDPFHTGDVPTYGPGHRDANDPLYWQDYYYTVVGANQTSIPNDALIELVFDLSGNPIPLWATDVSLWIVYQGQLGNEANAVAVGYADISEPTPISVANDMDKKCLNRMWYNAGSPEAVAIYDGNPLDGVVSPSEGPDIYPHGVTDIYIRIAPVSDAGLASSTDYTYYNKGLTLAPGEIKTPLYVLTEIIDNGADVNLSANSAGAIIDGNDHFDHGSFIFRHFGYLEAVIRQDDSWSYFIEHRGYVTWDILIYENSGYEGCPAL